MDLSPSQVSSATFRTVRKGYDPDEVDTFLQHVASALEQCQQQATAMEARARAAVARLQELAAAKSDEPPTRVKPDAIEARVVPAEPAVGDVHVQPDEAEMISRTLLLAQRTADSTVAEARSEAERLRTEAASEAERLRTEAQAEAEQTVGSSREMADQIVEEARVEARAVSDEERQIAENELQALLARRQFLVGDVDELETFLVDQRERLRAAARQIEALCNRVPAGLGHVRAPALSASDNEVDPTVEVGRAGSSADDAPITSGDDTAELHLPPEATGPFASASDIAASLGEEGLPRASAANGDEPEGPIVGSGGPELPHRHPDDD